jgi:hypothetical protein
MRPGIALALAASLASVRPAAASPEELFKWGEYDSLVRALEPGVSRPGYASSAPTRSDSLERARALLYLGVAYAATGRTAAADSAFACAFGLDTSLALDRFYVTPAIAARFDSVAAGRRRERRPAVPASPTDAVSAPPGPRPALAGPATPPSAALRTGRSDRAWLWWGMGITAAAAAGGGAWWYLSARAKDPGENVTTIDVRNAK